MLNILEELKVLIVRNGTSMTKTLKKMREQGFNVPTANNISTKFKNETVKFKEIQQILDFLGYELVIRKK